MDVIPSRSSPSREWTLVFTVGKRWKLTSSKGAGSLCRLARRPVWWSYLRPPTGLARRTDGDGQCEFRYQPEGWGQEYRFIALRYKKKPKAKDETAPQQYQLFDTPQYRYRVFVTNMSDPLYWLGVFYNQRAGVENLIKEANNDAGLAAHPSGRFETNRNYFQLAMLAYNLNCWLMLF
jgi:hypothetical protein